MKDGQVLLWAAVPIFVAILYVASVGPVARLLHEDAPELVETFYSPLVWAYHNTPAHDPLEAYLELWLDR